LFDIRDKGGLAQDFIAGLSLDDFKEDAVIRALEIICKPAPSTCVPARKANPLP